MNEKEKQKIVNSQSQIIDQTLFCLQKLKIINAYDRDWVYNVFNQMIKRNEQKRRKK